MSPCANCCVVEPPACHTPVWSSAAFFDNRRECARLVPFYTPRGIGSPWTHAAGHAHSAREPGRSGPRCREGLELSPIADPVSSAPNAYQSIAGGDCRSAYSFVLQSRWENRPMRPPPRLPYAGGRVQRRRTGQAPTSRVKAIRSLRLLASGRPLDQSISARSNVRNRGGRRGTGRVGPKGFMIQGDDNADKISRGAGAIGSGDPGAGAGIRS